MDGIHDLQAPVRIFVTKELEYELHISYTTEARILMKVRITLHMSCKIRHTIGFLGESEPKKRV